jgi:hypothetical protein
VYFSNNVLESMRDRFHTDKFYNSYASGMVPTEEGVQAVDSLISYICKSGKGGTL